MVLFSYEVDVLEIMLHESIDLVDKIVIVESSVSHRGVSSEFFFQELNVAILFLTWGMACSVLYGSVSKNWHASIEKDENQLTKFV